ncbi:MAG: hypothetical protein A2V46_04055 [Bacteroidetes bacterium RBG_19FT_COMBO_42_7]|nr:MAG: hypothetical protein A2V46_04055 [Bacteroidetes bacterium RBG_19FT_COMBO_42_7]
MKFAFSRYSKVVNQNITKMSRKIFTIISLVVLLVWSCGQKSDSGTLSENAILQEADGTLALDMEYATCYSDQVNPSSNTAEWNVVVSKPGTFKVWLSSATKDTTDLRYVNSVKLSLLDKLLEVDPECDKVVLNSKDVSLPYFRADSYMGSIYISEPGVYSIQVISEKVLSKEALNSNTSGPDDTKLMSVILAPMTR